MGVCNVDLAQLERAVAVAEIVSVQNRYNVVDREHEDVLERCEELGVAFLAWHPLASGELADQKGVASEAASRVDMSSAQLALAWLLARSDVLVPIPGTSRRAHLGENLAAARTPLPREEIAELWDEPLGAGDAGP